MRGHLVLALVFFAGTLLGIVTAQQAIGGRYALTIQSKGPWTVWPTAVQPRIDPYTRAHQLSYAFLPPNRFETLEYEAQSDSDGRMLDESCSYVLSGPMPKARWWTLQAVSAEKEIGSPEENTQGLISQEVVYEPDGTFRVVLSSEPQPGNWLKPPDSGPPVLLLRFHSPEAALRRNPLAASLPVVERRACR